MKYNLFVTGSGDAFVEIEEHNWLFVGNLRVVENCQTQIDVLVDRAIMGSFRVNNPNLFPKVIDTAIN